MKCRRVRISDIIEEPVEKEVDTITDEDETPITTGDETKVNNESIPKTQEPEKNERRKEEVAKIIVKKLLTECDYFDLMKESSPMVYNGIKEKIKYFQPAFHSMTPEGLNSRLTFLQQCIRPGDTIPVIGDDGRPVESSNATNTSFGAPPICVLRIGDFYHTKIAINQISITYEPLTFDMNPEGIGVQPMLADINMSFYFIGGQGLKEPVSRLQNALSFNYYANTEVYDDRSVVTEERSELNAQIWNDIEDNIKFLGDDKTLVTEKQPSIGTTIGSVLSENDTTYNNEDTVSGETSYVYLIDELPTKSKEYTDTVTNTLVSLSDKYSFDGLSYFTSDREYTEGKFLGYYGSPTYYTGTVVKSNLFGKPKEDKLQEKIDNLFSETINDIENDLSPLTKNLNNQNFKNKDKKRFKFNLTQKINTIKGSFSNDYFSVFNDMNNNQLTLINTIDKINFVVTNTDGYQTDKGVNILSNITGTTKVDISSKPTPANTYDEMVNDVTTVSNDIKSFYDEIFTDFIPKYDTNYSFTILDSPYKNDKAFVRLMHVCYDEIGNNPEGFINDILGDELKDKNEWVKYVNKIIYGIPSTPAIVEPLIMGSEGYGNNVILPEQPGVKGLVDIYRNVSVKSKNKLTKFKQKPIVTKFNDYAPFTSDKERIFDYTKLPKGQNNSDKESYFINLYKGVNVGDNKTFNGKISFK